MIRGFSKKLWGYMNLMSKTVFIACLFLSSVVSANEMLEVKIEVKLFCPPSEELQNLYDSLPKQYSESQEFEEWKQNFIASMKKTIELVESGKISGYNWSTNIQNVQR
jgi:hypothetical protein